MVLAPLFATNRSPAASKAIPHGLERPEIGVVLYTAADARSGRAIVARLAKTHAATTAVTAAECHLRGGHFERGRVRLTRPSCPLEMRAETAEKLPAECRAISNSEKRDTH